MYHTFKDNGAAKTLVLFHGTGGDENSLMPLANEVASHMNILSLRGDVVVNGMRRFAKVDQTSQLLDENDMLERVPGIQNILKSLKVKYNLGTLWALGFSNGANAITAQLLNGEPMFEQAILLRPMDFSVKTLEHPLHGLPVLIHSGRFDDILPLEHALGLEKRLQRNGAVVDHRIYDLDHRMRQFEIEDLKQWFAQNR